MTIKLRNRLIALVCLIVFLSLGAALFLNSTNRKPFAVILFIGDEITPGTLATARLFSGGGNARLEMENLPNAALCRNAANDFSVPESASASTALAGGKRVNRASLCIDPSGTKLASLLEEAASAGRSTGLISTGELAGATAAAFYAKTLVSDNRAELISQYCSHAPFDFVAGGGSADFELASLEGSPSPLNQLAGKGVTVLNTVGDLEKQPFWRKTPLLGLLARGPLTTASQEEGTPGLPSLSDVVRIAIEHLQGNRRGYLLVVDDPMIAEAASFNDGEAMLKRLLAFDQAVATARRYAGENALVVVAGRENVGGLQLNGYPFLQDKGVALLSLNAQGFPSLCWSTGPGHATEENGGSARSKKSNQASVGILAQPSAHRLPAAVGVAGDTMALGSGIGSEKLHGFLDLTDVHAVIRDAL